MSASAKNGKWNSPQAICLIYKLIITKRTLRLGLGAIIVLLHFVASADYINISSIPQISQIYPDQTYKFEVIADSTTIPDSTILAASWHINVPIGVTIVGAELPSQDNPSTNPTDFFHGVLMKSNGNFVDASVDLSGELTDNARGGVIGGCQNRIGDLGWYYFTVAPSLIGQTLSFELNHVYVLDNMAHNIPVNVTNSEFTVIPEPATIFLFGLATLGSIVRKKLDK